MKSLGTQHIAEFIDCKFRELNSPEILTDILKAAISASGLNQVKIFSHKFKPVGVTVLAIISESHVGIHTYPEANHISVDVFTCSDSVKQLKLVELLKKQFQPSLVKIVEVQRGNPIEVNDVNRFSATSSYGFEVKYVVDKIIYSGKTKYQNIDIIDNPVFGRMLFLDNGLQIAEKDFHIYNEAILSPVKQHLNGKNIVVLGGGDGTLLNGIIPFSPASITLVDIDDEVITLSKKYLNDFNQNNLEHPLVKIVNSDASKFLKYSRPADIIIYDLTMNPEAFTRNNREDYLTSLFEEIYDSLAPNGILTMQCGSIYDTPAINLSKKIMETHFNEFNFTEVFIPSFCKSWLFAHATKK